MPSTSVNGHTHLYSGLAPFGMPPPAPSPENFVQILERVWWRLDRALDGDSLRASARYYVAEALLAGTTTLVDHHESPNFIEGSLDVLADACHELGVRALVCYGATERNGGRDEAKRGLAECRRFIESNERRGIVGAVALHASFTVSDETIREAAALAKELETIVHVHVAEDLADVDDAKRRGWDGPLERLLELGALPRGSILAHGVHLDASQMKIASEAGLWLIQNPRSNRGNRVGYPKALAHASNVAIGTDGYPARMADEIEALREESEAHDESTSEIERRIAGGDRLARAIFGLDVNSPDDLRWDGDVSQSMTIGGREIIRDGRLMTADIDEIRAHAREQAKRLWDRMERL